ncbi:hypothetical protein FBF91_05855, partial [Campylobacter upsaliensis]|nr:hypothetical protein [Campylobacter upsaliensis]
MKTLYPINFDFSTKNLNFQQIARTFWKELGIRFTAVKVIYNAETGSKESIAQCRTGILEHDVKGKDLKPMQMSAIQYERLLAKDSYWLKYDQFAWTLADDSKICVIDLDFETDEEYQNFRKGNPGLDDLLDQAGYVEKTLKGGGYHFFLPKDLFNGL